MTSSNDHDHDHDHDHDEAHAGIQEDARLGYYGTRYRAIEALLIEKGICTLADVNEAVSRQEARTPKDGAKMIAHAWLNPEFKEHFISDPLGAMGELGYQLPANVVDTPKITVLENNEHVHHLVVCTLCSCYPGTLLGTPPDWYKSLTYRSRAVKDPRGVMREFGLDLAENVEIRVQDSTADMRYIVMPKRPTGTEGMEEEDLAKLITRDSMIGVSEALEPNSYSGT
jgi:nitrile hydratase